MFVPGASIIFESVRAHESRMLVDPKGRFEERYADLEPGDPLKFVDKKAYARPSGGRADQDWKSRRGRLRQGIHQGSTADVGGHGSDVHDGFHGERGRRKNHPRTIEDAVEEKMPILIVSCSGGARMQESALSLMQMAKTSAALARLDDAGGLFIISLLADPTTGGVTASFAMLGDFIIAEPKALIGFAGPRTIWNTIRVELPEGFQRSEFLQEKGFIDFVVHRKDLRSEIARLVDFCGK